MSLKSKWICIKGIEFASKYSTLLRRGVAVKHANLQMTTKFQVPINAPYLFKICPHELMTSLFKPRQLVIFSN